MRPSKYCVWLGLALLALMGGTAVAEQTGGEAAVLESLRAGGGGVGGGPLAGEIAVQVIDAATREPLAGAWVRLGEDGDKLAVADLQGRVVFAVAAGPVTVTAAKAGYGPTTFGAVRTRAVVLPLWTARPAAGSLAELGREIRARRSPLPRSFESSANLWGTAPAGAAAAAAAVAHLAQVTAPLTPPPGLARIDVRAGALLARLDGIEGDVQVGGGRADGADPTGPLHLVAPAAPDALSWSAQVLVRGPGGTALGTWRLAAAPPFAFAAPLAFAPVPVPLPAAAGAALRWAVAPAGGPALITVALELPDGRTWTALLPGNATRFSPPVIPGVGRGSWRWTVACHRFAALDAASWRLRDLAPGATSFAPPRTAGRGAYDGRLLVSPFVNVYALPETGAFLVERPGDDPKSLTF